MSVSARGVTFAAILSLSLVACQPATGPTSPAASTSTSGASSASPPGESSPPSQAAPSLLAGQTDTAWGRIWDSLPNGFPSYPGSTPAEEAASGPASAVRAVEGIDARTIAGWMQSELERATYSTEALSGPLEDGSYVLVSTGTAPGCRVQVSIAPLGGLTTVTVLYGASCPQP
ncbi:MAG: hypothetical protein ACXWNG_07165 [Candidatus Limnocylindrales bacterium]